ncbi:hypothetical protein HYS72_00265 [Candidatus Pacearchaeota archaeon]|nr:hypothetical protein [Candidatus Pacearchaeota archaeon]MBI2056855.1 hypothetical protein [Candidatus Pacearchaeota archaeon]
MRNLNEKEGNPFGDSFYNTRRYLSKLIPFKKDLSENDSVGFYWTLEQINYEIGVPLKYLEPENLTSFNQLVNICEKHRKSPSDYEKGLDDRISYLLALNLPKQF